MSEFLYLPMYGLARLYTEHHAAALDLSGEVSAY